MSGRRVVKDSSFFYRTETDRSACCRSSCVYCERDCEVKLRKRSKSESFDGREYFRSKDCPVYIETGRTERRLPATPKRSSVKSEHAPQRTYFLRDRAVADGYCCCGKVIYYSGNHHSGDRLEMIESNYDCRPDNKYIENEEPHLSKSYYCDSKDYYRGNGQQKTPLKSILINNTRRSVSPSYFRKQSRGKPPDLVEIVKNGESKRRVRARSESEKMCLINDSCSVATCNCTQNVQKKARDASPPRLSLLRRPQNCDIDSIDNSRISSGYSGQKVCHRDVGVGDWSVYDGELPSPTIEQHQRKIKSCKTKQSSAKIKSRLLAIKAKKAILESCSTGSDLSDDELSDLEDVASKGSVDRDSDISAEPVDNQECLTSDSGPSVSSASDSASLNGLSSALSAGAVVATEQECLKAMLRPSLFCDVPPYLRFLLHDSTPLRPPLCVQRHLRWKLTTITPVVVRKTLLSSGFKLVRSESATQGECMDWIGTWGKHMKSMCFKTLKDSQKMNHFPGTSQIGRKDRLWRNLQKLMAKHGAKEFGFMPKTYVLPFDLKALKHDWDKYVAQNEKWIIKPPASARGTGIKVVSRWAQIPKKRPVVVQRYIAKPYLINGSKFDLRLYVLVTSVHPLRIYLYPDGLARFASVKYSEELDSLSDKYMHLTNYSINRHSKSYTHNQDASACQGHKWTLQALLKYLRTECGVDTDQLWLSMKDLVIKTILSGESTINRLTKANLGSRFNCYELFGIDILLDEHLKPWLLEVNISPSLHSASPLDLHVKGPLVAALFNMAQFHLPTKVGHEDGKQQKGGKLSDLKFDWQGPLLHDKRLYTVHLSKEEKAKHAYFMELENRIDYLVDILTNLTPDDVRHLIQYEDELTQKGCLEKVFPSEETHKYHDYFAGPRYYNQLFDAWEAKYHNNRKAGIKRLQELCERGVHLEVPPMPAKSEDESPETSPQVIEPPIKIISVNTQDRPMETATVVSHECPTETGKDIVGEFCLICKPAPTICSPIILSESPLPVQQQA